MKKKKRHLFHYLIIQKKKSTSSWTKRLCMSYWTICHSKKTSKLINHSYSTCTTSWNCKLYQYYVTVSMSVLCQNVKLFKFSAKDREQFKKNLINYIEHMNIAANYVFWLFQFYTCVKINIIHLKIQKNEINVSGLFT